MQANKRKMSNIDKHDMTWWNKDGEGKAKA